MGRAQSRAPRTPARSPVVVLESFGLILGVGTLAGIAYLAGHGRPYRLGAVLDEVAATVTRPGPALMITLLAFVELAWCVRQLLFESLAWRPGSIEVSQLAIGQGTTEADADALTLSFRRRLAELRLQAPTGAPGAAPQGDFLDVLGSGGVDARNIFGSLLSLVRAARPTHAYHVDGVLLERDGSQRYGVAVQVMCLPNRARVPVTVWSTSWEAAVRQGADSVTQAILPNTRLCRDQWASWRRFIMPEGLLHAYEEGARLEQDRRYDEALRSYYDALRLDPMNLAVRLQVGKLQEKLGLHLDAFATYQGILAVAKPGEQRSPRYLYRPATRRLRRHALLVARHRRIVLMGGANLAEQWQRTAADGSGQTRRDHHRDVLRQGLRVHLNRELDRAADRHDDPRNLPLLRQTAGRVGKQDIRVLVAGEVVDDQEQARLSYLELREVLALAALDALPPVKREARFDRRASLAAPTVELTKQAIKQRLDWIRQKLDADDAAWPPTAKSVKDSVSHVEGQTRFRTWQEHYNAACVCAVPLLDDNVDGPLRDELARAAVARLQQATACADSAFIATRRDWLVGEDPDFNGLRTHLAFKRFEAMYFPAARPAPLRPSGVQRLESSRHVQALVVATAARWQEVWHRRGRSLERRPDVHVVLRWWEDEYEAWRQVREVAVHYRHWETRLQLVSQMAALSERYEIDPLVVPSPRYEDNPLEDARAGSCDVAIRRADARLDALADALPEAPGETGAHAMLEDIKGWQARLKQIGLTGDEPGRYFLAELCDCHAGLWQLVETWLAGDDTARDAFEAQIDKARMLWCTAYDWWRPQDVMLALASRDRRNGGVPPLRVLRWQATEWWRDRGAVAPPGG